MSEIARGLHLCALQPSGLISANEIPAATTVHLDYLNVQGQPKLSWPPSFAVAGAYLDQLARGNGLAADKLAAARTALGRAEHLAGQRRKDAPSQLATQLSGGAAGSRRQQKKHT